MPVGRSNSCHKQWLYKDRAYDLMLVNYSSTPRIYAEDADFYFEATGFKLEILREAIRANVDVVRSYQAVWLPDDDLEVSPQEGVEWLWPEGLAANTVAIIDAVSVRHTKTIERDGPYYSRLAKIGIDPLREEEQLLARHKLPGQYIERGVVYSGNWRFVLLSDPFSTWYCKVAMLLLKTSRPVRRHLGIVRRCRA